MTKQQRIKQVSNRKYRHSLEGFLGHKYFCCMRSRVLGYKGLGKTYKGVPLCSWDDFKTWALQDKTLKQLYKAWVESGFSKTLTPSIDRLASKGLCPGQYAFLSHGRESQSGNAAETVSASME